jgi:hypothetical protein
VEKFDAAAAFLDTAEVPTQASIDDHRMSMESDMHTHLLDMVEWRYHTPEKAEEIERNFHMKLWGINPPEVA